MKRRNFLAAGIAGALVAAREAFVGDVEADEPQPMLCVQHGGSPNCEASNRRHGFKCPKCQEQPKQKLVFVPCSNPSEANVIVTVKGQRYEKKLVCRTYDYSPFVNNSPQLVEAFRYEYTKLDDKGKVSISNATPKGTQ